MLELLRKLFGGSQGKPGQFTPQHQEALTGKKSAEDSLHKITEHFNQLVAGVRDYAIFLLDAEGKIRSWNAGAERIKGYTAKEIIGRHFSCFYTPDAVAKGWPAYELQEAVATGRFEDEGWRVRKDGSLFWANVVITALREELGAVPGFLKITRDMTERKQAEENARRLIEEEAAHRAAEATAKEARHLQQEESRQREQLQVTLRSIGDAVIVTDMQGKVTFLNPVAEKLTGWKSPEATGQPLERVFHIINEDTRQRVDNPVHQVIRDGITVGLANHTVLIDRNGGEKPIDDSAAPIRGEESAASGVVLVFRDVSETRRALEARLRLAAIVDSSDDAIISKSLEGIITSWNKGAERLFGYSAQEIVGQPLSLLVPPDHPNELPAIMDKLKRGERVERFETVRLAKDGKRVEVSLTISPIKNAAGKIIGASKIARDITDRKRQESDLHFLAAASKLLAELLDVPSTLRKIAALAVPHFADWCTVDMLEPDGFLRRLAVAHVDPAKVALAHDLARRFPPDPQAPIGVWNVLRGGKAEIIPEITDALLEETVKNPEMRDLLRQLGLHSYMAVPLNLRGKTEGVITFIAAESARRYGPADLNLAEDLGSRAAVAIDNARLFNDLKEAGQRKDEFLAMLAHELRNPLAPIRNALQVLKLSAPKGDAAEQALEMTERQVEFMVRLVDDLLDVSRIMRGRIELRKAPIGLADVLARGVEIAQPIIDAQKQELIVAVPREEMHLEADQTRLAQVVANLLHNAAKFSEPAGRIWLTAERQGAEALIHVKDEGAGIRAELLPFIFDLFVQGDGSLERSRGGLGIGLTVVRQLVELHGGTIMSRSDGPGKGSEFVIRLPILQDAVSQEPAAPGARPTTAKVSQRVLVVDDNIDAAESVAMLLRLWGHQVRLAHNGPEALQAAEEFLPQAIVLDIGLPGMSGYEVAKKLRQKKQFQKTILMAVTGYGQQDDRRRSCEAGFDHHFTKPVDPLKLQSLLTPESPQPKA